MRPLYKQQTTLSAQYIQTKIDEFLIEDMAHQDLTTQFISNSPSQLCTAHIIAEEDLIFSGAPIINYIFKQYKMKQHIHDGTACKPGDRIYTITAPANLLLSHERIILNLIQRLCGITTLTTEYVNKLNSNMIKILDTRKTTPGLRLFEKYAVHIGGGYNHRVDLYDGVMIKDNHLTIIDSLEEFLYQLHKQYPNIKTQIEIDNFQQLKQIITAKTKVRAVLLDNMDSKETIECVAYITKALPTCFIESSGGINLNNITHYRNTGVHGISIGALTHQAVCKNIKLEFKHGK